ncbi:bacillithiol system redox-active protein YtxJ [Ascidiimonas aurantiaca]|uniref:bacillithiol system redox-active protein YtxJ n=1 Tax=Ascidiimonas aurantiaca TaxID=1685432 RepID=UPI0030EE60D2
MGFFTRKKKGEEKEKENPQWRLLTSQEQLVQIIEDSQEIPVGIFKHSTRCGISGMVLRGFESAWPWNEEKVHLYLLDLLNQRDLSNYIASELGVWHESPQFLLIKKGKVIYHASHGAITVPDVTMALVTD